MHLTLTLNSRLVVECHSLRQFWVHQYRRDGGGNGQKLQFPGYEYSAAVVVAVVVGQAQPGSGQGGIAMGASGIYCT